MNTNINNFSFSRMLRFMAADMYNRRTTLFLFLALAFLGTSVYYFLMRNQVITTYPDVNLPPLSQINLTTRGIIQGVWAAFGITMMVYTSMIFTPFFKRGYAAQNIMIPASRCEKFISRILDITLVTVAIIAICSLLTFIFIKYAGATISVFPFYKIYSDVNGYPIVEAGEISGILTSIITSVMFGAIYFFGAAFWRKLHFIKTSATILSVFIIAALYDSLTGNFDITGWFSEAAWNSIFITVTIIFMILAWVRFRKIQIKG